MCKDLNAIMEFWKEDELMSKGIHMVYRKEENDKVDKQAGKAILLFLIIIMGMITSLVLCFSKHVMAFLIPFAYFILLAILFAKFLIYFLFRATNYDYTIEIMDDKLVYRHKYMTKTISIPFTIHQCEIPFALFYHEEAIVLSDISDSDPEKKPNSGIFSDDVVLCNTVSKDGKELLDFLMEANCQFLDKQETP